MTIFDYSLYIQIAMNMKNRHDLAHDYGDECTSPDNILF